MTREGPAHVRAITEEVRAILASVGARPDMTAVTDTESLLNSGVGNLIGYLGVGVWFTTCASDGHVRWTLFWSGLSLAAASVLVFFLAMYRGRGPGGLRGAS